jgi:hypothetical protein
MKNRRMLAMITMALAIVFLVSILAPVAVFASSKGRSNTAIGLTAGAVYSIIRGKTLPALALGAGSVYAWHRYSQARKAENAHRYYRAGYGAGYRSAHYSSNRGVHRGWSHSRYYNGRGH